AVRMGDLELFRNVANSFAATFRRDGTQNLVGRVRFSVIRTGLRNISRSYSRISLADISEKLRLNPEIIDVESIVAKAISDGIIDAKLDHTNGWMISTTRTVDVYTFEPRIALDERILVCLEMHNKLVQAGVIETLYRLL
ncbi:hypothetical protein UlMin_034028, partial [Ulmus minor]